MKSCFFIGHREISSVLLLALAESIEHNCGGFDRMAAKAVIATRERYPDITLSMLIPYHPASNAWDLIQHCKKTVKLMIVTALARS